MANLYDGIDFLWDGTLGDFAISNKGDWASTEFDPLHAIAQDVYTRVKSDRGDWPEAPLLGATLSDFVGEPNSQDTGTKMKKRILTALQTYGTIRPADVLIDVIPISKEQVAVTIKLSVMPTARNKSSRVLKRTYMFSYMESNVYARS
jgi:hypothetical protein